MGGDVKRESSWWWLKAVLSSLAFSLALILCWGVLIEPYIVDEENITAEIPALSPQWGGREIAVLGDFQIGMWWDNPSTAARMIDIIIERKPAAVLILGDFIYHPAGQDMWLRPDKSGEAEVQERVRELTAEVLSLLRPLAESQIPTFAVLGNHDYAQESRKKDPIHWVANHIHSEIERIGIHVLENEAIAISLNPDGEDQLTRRPASLGADNELYIVGVGAYEPKLDNPDLALAQVPASAPRVVMFHHPDTFEKIPANSAPFAIAGHTHGGQLRIPLTESWSWLGLVQKGRGHIDGWIKDEDFGAEGNRLYVNRGVGFSVIPVRIQAPPELTFVTLKRDKDEGS